MDKSIWFGVSSGLHSGKKSLPFFREVFKEGKKRKWVFTLTNNSDIELKDVSVKPDLGETEDTWPFETNRQDYEKTVKKLSPRQRQRMREKQRQRMRRIIPVVAVVILMLLIALIMGIGFLVKKYSPSKAASALDGL